MEPLFDPTLQMNADSLDDIERTRISNENRLRTLTMPIDEHGAGLDPTNPDVARLVTIVQMMRCDSKVVKHLGIPKPVTQRGKPCCIEHAAVKNLERAMRNHPLGPWAEAQKGVGPKTSARLLAAIGDPYVNLQTGETRTVSQLWAYCGNGDPNRKKRKGMTQEDALALGNPTAKKRLYLIAETCLKAQGHYADVYYARKTANEGRLHATDCVRCGPSGHPALAGTPWKDSHRHADALRIVGKHILKDLWTAARELHEQTSDPGHGEFDAHTAVVGVAAQPDPKAA